MVALALKNRGLLPSNYGTPTVPSRTSPYSTNTTPKSYSAMNVGGMSMGAANPGGKYSALNVMGANPGGMSMGAANPGGMSMGTNNPGGQYSALSSMKPNAPGGNTVYAKPAFKTSQNKPNVPPNQLGQNLLDFATSPQGRGFARGLLEASGYSTTPVSFGQALAQGMAYMTEADKTDAEKNQQEFENELKKEELNISKAAEQRQQEVFDYEIGKTQKTQQIFQNINRSDFETPEKYYEAIGQELLRAGNIEDGSAFLQISKPQQKNIQEFNKDIVSYNKDEAKAYKPIKKAIDNFRQLENAIKQEGGASSYATMIKFIKNLDDSVVREGEVRSFEAFQGLVKNLNIKVEKAKGKGFPPSLKLEIINLARKNVEGLINDYGNYVEEKSNMYDSLGYTSDKIFAGNLPTLEGIKLNEEYVLSDITTNENNEDEIFVSEEEVRKGAGKVPRWQK